MDDLIRVLVVDDKESQYVLIRDLLGIIQSNQYQLDWAVSYEEALEQTADRAYDVCLVDYALGEQSGLNVIRDLRAQHYDVPLILLTGHRDRSIDFEAMKLGAVDYLDKTELKPRMLERSIRYAVERHRSSTAMRASETRLRQVLETVSVGVFILQQQRMVYVNPMVSVLSGFSMDELLEMDFVDLIHPGMQEQVADWLGDSGNFANLPQSTFLLVTRTGNELWINLTLTPIEHERQPAVLGAFIDVTKNRQMQIALLESEKRFRSLIENSHDLLILLDGSGKISYLSPAVHRITGYREGELIDRSLFDDLRGLTHPDDFSIVRSSFERLLRDDGGEIVTFRSRLQHKNGSWLWIEALGSNLLDESSVQAVVINARDITESVQALDAEHQQRSLAEALLDTSSVLNSTLDVDEVLDRILSNVGSVVKHDGVNIGLIEEGELVFAGYRGYEDPALIDALQSQQLVVSDTPLLRFIMETHQPLVVPDALNYPGFTTIPGFGGLRSYIGVPIVCDGEVIGLINVDRFTPDFFQPTDGERLKVFGDQASIAIQNAQAYEQAQELAAAQERQRLARDLHDAVSQTLFSANVIAETLPRLMDHDMDEVKDGLLKLGTLTKGALAEMRTLLIELRPDDMVEIELSVMIRHLVNGMRGRSGAEVKFDIIGDDSPLPTDVKMTLYRVVQEALNNVAKHARATHVSVMLAWGTDRVGVRVHDNGRGFDQNAIPAGHMGLRIMRERAEATAVKLTTASARDGSGTQVEAVWLKGRTYE